VKIGVAGPIDLTLLRDLLPQGCEIPRTYSFPLIGHLTRSLHRRGHEMVVFALSMDVSQPRRIEGERITVILCPQRRPRMQMLDLLSAERRGLLEAMRDSGCSVIHAHWTYEFAWAALQSGLPCVVTAHDVPSVVMRYARHPYWLEKPLLAFNVLRKAKCITAVSPYAADAIRGWVKSAPQITVVPNGVTEDIFDLHTMRQARTAGGPIHFAAVLNDWYGRKNGTALLEAFSIVRKQAGERVRLSMFGEEHQREGEAHQWARQHGVADGVEFLGSLPYAALMRRLAETVDVLVHPALEESFCMVAAEAMAMGVPVIGGAHSGGITWVLDEGRAGLLADVTSPKAIAQGMRTMVEDEQQRGRLARAGRERALKEFQLESVVQRYEVVLEQARQEQSR